MTPEAFLELCEQNHGTSTPGFVKAVTNLVNGEEETETFEEVMEKGIRELERIAYLVERGREDL